MTLRRLTVLLLLSLLISGFSIVSAQDAPLKVVATYSILGDLVQNVAGENIELTVLVGPDGDSHVYEPTPQDAIALAEADLIFENGLEFETWLDALYEASGSTAQRIVVSEGITPLAWAGHDDHDHDHEGHDHDHEHEGHDHDHEHEGHDHEHHHHDEVDLTGVTDFGPWEGEGISAYAFLTTEAAHDVYHLLADELGISEEDAENAVAEFYGTSFSRVSIAGNTITFDGELVCEYALYQEIPNALVFETQSEGCAAYQFWGASAPHGEGKGYHYHARYATTAEGILETDSPHWDPFVYPAELTTEEYLDAIEGGASLSNKVIATLGLTVEEADHDHDHDHEGHDHDDHHGHDHDHEVTVDVYAIEDLHVWEGDWVSGYSHLQDETGHAAIHALADNLHVEEAAVEEVFEALLFTDFDRISIDHDSIRYGDLTCEYALHGVVETDFEGSAFQWIVFESATEGCEAYQNVLFTIAHGEGAGAHYHLRYGSDDIDTLVNSPDLALWYPSLYDASVSPEDFAASVAESGEWDGFIAGVLGVEVHDHSHDHDHDHEGHGHDDHHGHDHDHEGHDHGEYDPHIWQDPNIAVVMVANIAAALSEADAANAESYAANAAAYTEALVALDAYIREQVESIPAENRILVTSHETFAYFAATYGFELRSVMGLSTESADPGAGEIAALIESLREVSAPAVFTENIANEAILEQVAREAGVTVGGALYTDALGQAGTSGENYLSMVRYNVDTIVGALQ